MIKKRLFVLAFTVVASINSYSSNGGNCELDSGIEVSELHFSFGLDAVKKVKILNAKKASVYISFKDAYLPDLHVITTDEAQASGGINKSGGFGKLGVSSLKELFVKAKTDGSNDDYFTKVKQVLGLADPEKISVIKKDTGDMFLINDSYENGADTIYVIRHNDARIMMLVADLTQKQANKLIDQICL